MAQQKRVAFQLRVDKDFLRALDDLRTAERPIQTRAETIRRLVFRAAEKRERRLANSES